MGYADYQDLLFWLKHHKHDKDFNRSCGPLSDTMQAGDPYKAMGAGVLRSHSCLWCFKSLYRWIEDFNLSSYTETNNLSRQSRAKLINIIELF